MTTYLSKYDIMWLLGITPAAFEWYRERLNIVPIKDKDPLLKYSIQNMIDMYLFMIRKKPIILQSKINYKEMWV